MTMKSKSYCYSGWILCDDKQTRVTWQSGECVQLLSKEEKQ